MNKKTSIIKERKLFWFLSLLFIFFLLPKVSFGAGGDLIWDPAIEENLTDCEDMPYAIAVDSTGVYVAGYSYPWRVEKRSLDGQTLIWKIDKSFSGDIDIPFAIAVDSTGPFPGVYVAGFQADEHIWRVEKRSLDGTGGIDGNGLLWEKTDDFGSDWVTAHGVAVDSTGVYVVGEYIKDEKTSWRVEKRSLDGTGGIDGNGLLWEKIEDFGSEWTAAYSVAVDPTGVYVVGYQYLPSGNTAWRVEKRNRDDGSLTGGWEKIEDFGVLTAYFGFGVAVDSKGVYVVGSYQNWDVGSNTLWRVEKRSLDGTGGIDGNGLLWEKTEDFSPGWAEPYGVAVDSTGVYIAGSNDGDIWRVEKRSLDGTGGIDGNGLLWEKTEDFHPGYWDIPFAVAVDSDGVYVAGSVYGVHEFDIWRVEKREKTSPNTLPTAISLAVSRQDCCFQTGARGYFEWTFSDPDTGADQYFYEIEIDDDLVIDPALDPGDPTPPSKYGQPGLGYNPDNPVFTAGLAGFPNFAYTPDKRFPFNRIFYWRLRVEDDQGGSSGWINGPDFEVGLEAPNPDFLCNGVDCTTILPALGEQITLVNTSQCCDAPYLSCSYVWDFDTKTDTSGDGNPANDQDSTLKDPSPISYSTAGIYTVRLTTTNALDTCFREHNINVEATTLLLPQWKEIAPF